MIHGLFLINRFSEMELLGQSIFSLPQYFLIFVIQTHENAYFQYLSFLHFILLVYNKLFQESQYLVKQVEILVFPKLAILGSLFFYVNVSSNLLKFRINANNLSVGSLGCSTQSYSLPSTIFSFPNLVFLSLPSSLHLPLFLNYVTKISHKMFNTRNNGHPHPFLIFECVQHSTQECF